nr:hypothetical protein [Micromonospora sp. ALFpr18c]
MAAQGPPWDLVGDFGVPFAIGVIADLFGVPEADRPQFAQWSQAMTATCSMPLEVAQEHVRQLQEYVADLFIQRLSSPTDDLIGALIEGYQADSRVDEHEVITLARLMLATGHGSVSYQLAHCSYFLLSHPAQLARLATEPGLINLAVEELLRYAKTDEAAVFARCATQDIRVGELVVRPVRRYCRRASPRTTTTRCSPIPTCSISPGPEIRTSRSGTGRITAPARTWPGRSCRSPSGR